MRNLKNVLDLEYIESVQEESKVSLLYYDTLLEKETGGCRVTQPILKKYISVLTKNTLLVNVKSPAYYKEFSSVYAIDEFYKPLCLVVKIGVVYSLNKKYNFLLLLYNFLSAAFLTSFLITIFSFNLFVKSLFKVNY